jgi:hypothetical protein
MMDGSAARPRLGIKHTLRNINAALTATAFVPLDGGLLERGRTMDELLHV